MVSTLPADRTPPAAATPADILDTTDAGPAVIRGGLVRLGAYGIGTLATVASSAVVIRHLGLIDTGHFTTVTALVMIVATISDLGLTGIAVREYAAGPKSDGQLFLRNLLGIRFAIALSGLVVAVLFGLLVGYPPVMVIGTVIAGAGMIVVVAQDGCSIPLQVGLRFGWVAGLQLLIQVGAAIEAVGPRGRRPAPLLCAATARRHSSAYFDGDSWRSRLPSRSRARHKEWRRMVGLILPFSAAVVLSVVYFQIAQIMVSVLSSSTETGISGFRSACWPHSPRCRRCSFPRRSLSCPRGATMQSDSAMRAANSRRRMLDRRLRPGPRPFPWRRVRGHRRCRSRIWALDRRPSQLAFALLEPLSSGPRLRVLSLDRRTQCSCQTR